MARILFLSDIHGNFDALKAIINEVSSEMIYCPGDLVDYGPGPVECILKRGY